MDNTQLLKSARDKFDGALEFFEGELVGVRSGRAHPGLVENIKVNVYGQTMPLKGVATISAPDPKTIQIQPWDHGQLAPIEKALREDQNLGLNPSNDGHVIRIAIPSLSEESRLQLKKLIGQKAEACNISLRNIRHEVLAQAKKSDGSTPDQLKGLEKELNKLIDEYQAKITTQVQTKESELMTV
jgi:ribosome recycling factor